MPNMNKSDMLVCWIENGGRRWEMVKGGDDSVFLLNLLNNEDVWKHSIFIIPVSSIMGGIWLWKATHKSQRVDFLNFFKELDVPYVKPKADAMTEELAEDIRKRRDDDTLYGFVSPEGKYFHQRRRAGSPDFLSRGGMPDLAAYFPF